MSDSEIGQVIDGRYQIRAVAGTGGMARVYRAVELMTGRPVALKVLLDPYASDKQYQERFRREGLALAQVKDHEHVVQVYDAFRDRQSGEVFLAMEHLSGETVRERLKRKGVLAEAEAVAIAAQAAAGLQAIHDARLVHRDVKPGNLLVTAENKVKLLDFGVVSGDLGPSLTVPGEALGTAHYVSPEQIRGQKAGPAADIYSLGVVLYEMLTGQCPFDHPRQEALLEQHLTRQPRPPSSLNARVPAALDALVLKALSKEIVERFASAAEMRLALLELIQPGQQPNVTPPGNRGATPRVDPHADTQRHAGAGRRDPNPPNQRQPQVARPPMPPPPRQIDPHDTQSHRFGQTWLIGATALTVLLICAVCGVVVLPAILRAFL